MAENSRRGVWAPEPDTRIADLTAEQKAGMDKALAGANVNEARMIPPPESAPAAPAPAGPQRSVPALGADLQRAGVTMDLDKG